MFRSQDKRLRFERAALPHLDAVYRFALHLTGDENEAQDLAQECFQQAYRKFHQFEEGTNCRAWLFRITRNTHIDRLRHRGRQPRTQELQELHGSEPDSEDGATLLRWQRLAAEGEEALFELFGDEVSHSLRDMPRDFRIAVLLCDVEQFTYEEISEVLDCPVGTVRSRISRGRSFLKERLEDYARDLGYARPRKDED